MPLHSSRIFKKFHRRKTAANSTTTAAPAPVSDAAFADMCAAFRASHMSANATQSRVVKTVREHAANYAAQPATERAPRTVSPVAVKRQWENAIALFAEQGAGELADAALAAYTQKFPA